MERARTNWEHDLSLSDSDGPPPTPGRGIQLTMTGGEKAQQVQQVVLSSPPVPPRPRGVYSPPGRYVPVPHRVITCMAGRRAPRGKDAPRRPPKERLRVPPKPGREEAEVSTTSASEMRAKGTPSRAKKHIPTKKEDEMAAEARAKRRRIREEAEGAKSPLDAFRRGSTGRVSLPPRVTDGESDEERWLEDGQFYQNRLEEEWHDAPDHRLKVAVSTFKGTCPFWTCRQLTGTFSLERFKRHLVEMHAARHPVLGCKDDASCAVNQKGYTTRRRGDFIRHMMATHSVGAEKAIGFLRDLLRYPERDNRPKGAFYPRHVFFRLEENTNQDRLRMTTEGTPTPRSSAPAAAASATDEVEEAVEVLCTLEDDHPVPATPCVAPSSPVQGVSAGPVPVSSPPETVTPLATSSPVKYREISFEKDDDPVSATASRLFMSHWDRATAEAISGFQEAIRQTRKEMTGEQQQLQEQVEALRSDLEAERGEVERLRTALAEEQQRSATLERTLQEGKKASRETLEEAEFLRVKYQSIENRMEKHERAFTRVTGASLHDWDGRRESLKRALDARPEVD